MVDQFYRASESLLLNLAEAARQQHGPARLQQAEYAIGSSLECAGCLDLAAEGSAPERNSYGASAQCSGRSKGWARVGDKVADKVGGLGDPELSPPVVTP